MFTAGPEPMTFELFLGTIVWFFKTYLMVILGVMGFIVAMALLIGLFVYLRYRKTRKEIMDGTALGSMMKHRIPRL